MPSKSENVPVSTYADRALADRCRAQVPGAFEEVYRAYAPRMFGLICRMTGRSHAEDLLQETFLTAHRKLGSYRGDAALGTWLFRVATNVCLDHLRSRGYRSGRLMDELPDEVQDERRPESAVLGVIDRLDLERAVSALPPGARTVFVLHDVEGFEHREIAAMLDISEGTSKSQLHRARLRLRDLLASPAVPGERRA
ncbi:MAG: RNA polymerase sigma factor [Acidobacteria bacterium]|nr:RNA polymerase sigma factor [Acidobacteriota bacterium]